MPHYELWTSINDFSITTKSWNTMKMREISSEVVEGLIKTNFSRIKKVVDKLEDSRTQIIIKQILKEIDDL